MNNSSNISNSRSHYFADRCRKQREELPINSSSIFTQSQAAYLKNLADACSNRPDNREAYLYNKLVSLNVISYIPIKASHILGAPNLANDFNFSTIAWGNNNLITIITEYVQDAVFITSNHTDGKFSSKKIYQDKDKCLFNCLTVNQEPNSLIAIGRNDHSVIVVDAVSQSVMANLNLDATNSEYNIDCHSLTFLNNDHLFSGDNIGCMHLWDLRASNKPSQSIKSHDSTILNIKLSSNEFYIATGSSDTKVSIRDLRKSSSALSEIKTESPVRALDWSPTHSSLLATGSGIHDRKIRVYDLSSKSVIASIDTKAQVTHVVWQTANQLISGGGSSLIESCQNTINYWNFYENKLSSIRTNTYPERVIEVAINPKREWCATLSDVLHLWNLKTKSISVKKGIHSPIQKSKYPNLGKIEMIR